MAIDFSSAAAQWREFVFLLGFSCIVGLIVGGVFEQATRDKRLSRQFWPAKWTAVVAGLVIGATVGTVWGRTAALRPIYRIECSNGEAALWSAASNRPTRARAEAIDEIRRRLVTGRGARPWSLRLYLSDGSVMETERISERDINGRLEQLRSCVACARSETADTCR